MEKEETENKLINERKNAREELCELLSEIEENICNEAEARQGYYELMEKIEDPDDIDIIAEIISDELNHAELMKEMARRYSGIDIAKD